MATARLILGAGATQYVLSANAASSTYGGAARTDMALRIPADGFSRIDSGSRTLVTVLIHIEAADADTFASRYDELRSSVTDTTRDFDLQHDTGSSWLTMTVSDRSYVSVSGEMEADPISATSALIACSFIGERKVASAPLSGASAGTIENPTGLQDAIQYQATFDETGNLARLVATATFVGASGAEAQERASTWRTLWQSSLPDFLSGSATMKDRGADFSLDSTRNECVCSVTLERLPDGAPEVAGTLSGFRYQASIQPHTLGHLSGDESEGAGGGAGKILSVSGEVTLYSTNESEFGGPTAATTADEAVLVGAIEDLVEHAKLRANAKGAKALVPLSIDIRNNGWAAAFSYTALVNSSVIRWTETVTQIEINPSTIVRSADGRDWVYRPIGGNQKRVRVQWSAEMLAGGVVPQPFSPDGAELVDNQETVPAYTTLKGAGTIDDSTAVTFTMSGSREYVLISEGVNA